MRCIGSCLRLATVVAAAAVVLQGCLPDGGSSHSGNRQFNMAHGGTAALGEASAPSDAVQSRERYDEAAANPVKQVKDAPISTFSVDVDTAAYSNVRRYLDRGVLPPSGAVRTEELVNYFRYAYAQPTERAAPFGAGATVVPTPWNPDTWLLHIGIQGFDPTADHRPPLNLVFLIDSSGSMQDPDKLPLVKQSLRLLVQELAPEDRVGIVTYGGEARTVLEPTAAADRRRILGAINGLSADGYTPGHQGIQQAYAMAEQGFEADAVNRVLIATDGDFNVGITDHDQLEDYIARKRASGVYLTVLGYGTGNLNDALMQRLAQAGNGIAAYIDTLNEARKVLVTEMTANLVPIANDVKIQVEFNPARIQEYRLIGYETRQLRREDFSNDQVDAGDIGSGHQVTALYELTPPDSPALLHEPLRYWHAVGRAVGPPTTPPARPDALDAAANGTPDSLAGEFAFVRIRYKLPGQTESRLIEMPVTSDHARTSLSEAGPEVQFATAVAAFGQLLRQDPYTRRFDYQDVLALAQPSRGEDPHGVRAEFVQLVRTADSLVP